MVKPLGPSPLGVGVPAESERASRRYLLLFAAVVLFEAALLGSVAARLGVDADEGFYAFAAREVHSGQRIYTDFFFPQMPYLPYVTAPFLDADAPSIMPGRAVNVVSGALTAGLLAWAAAAWSGRMAVGLTVGAMLAASPLYLLLLSVGKTYGLANLGLVAAFLLLARPQLGIAGAALAGACAAVALGARLPAAAAVVVLAAWSLRHGGRPFLAFAAGGVVASLPWLVVFARDPEAFWFCNFGFHELRREITDFGAIVSQKANVLAKWTLLPQNFLLWVLAAVGVWREPRIGVPALACALALALGYLAATPTYLQYFLQLMPFLVIAAVPAIAVLVDRRVLLGIAAIVSLVGLGWALRPPADGSKRAERIEAWRLDHVTEVAAYLRDHTRPGDRILSWWEGYPLLAHREGFTGVGFWESNVAKKLPPERRRRHHVLGREEVAALIETRAPALIVFPEGTWEEHAAAVAAGYHRVRTFGALQVWAPRAD